MSSVPPRESRVLQAAESLRCEIQQGNLVGFLPGERELSRRLKVGRVTAAGALRILEEEKWISVAEPGKRRRVLKEFSGAESPLMGDSGVSGKTVVVLSPVSLENVPSYERLNHLCLVAYCLDAGVSLRHRALDLSHLKRPAYRLLEFTRQNPADLYILQLAGKEVQQWFSENQVPCVVTGSTWPEIQLPSVDLAQRAIGVHTASLMHRLGHTKVGMLYPQPDRRGMQLFVEGLKSAHASMQLNLAHVEDTPESIERALRSLMGNQERRPSVLILPRMPYVMAAVTLLPSMGLRIPEDVSLLCLVHDEGFNFLTPKVAGYASSSDHFSKAVFQAAVELMRYPQMEGFKHVEVMPEFVASESLVLLSRLTGSV